MKMPGRCPKILIALPGQSRQEICQKSRFYPERSLHCSICFLRRAPTFVKLLSAGVSPEIFTQQRVLTRLIGWSARVL